MNSKDIPNFISIFRLILVIPIIFVLLEKNYPLALTLFFIAGVSDGLDGFLAKRFQWSTKLGTLLDPMADKILLNSCYVVLTYLGLVPWWLTGIIFTRDLVLTVVGLHYYFNDIHFTIQPTILSKLNTLLQILLVFSIIFVEFLSLDISLDWLMILVFITTSITGIDYFNRWKNKKNDTVAS
jgi:cardiolipin synthase (CMP-forming)